MGLKQIRLDSFSSDKEQQRPLVIMAMTFGLYKWRETSYQLSDYYLLKDSVCWSQSVMVLMDIQTMLCVLGNAKRRITHSQHY
jgi:hypothetical protein